MVSMYHMRSKDSLHINFITRKFHHLVTKWPKVRPCPKPSRAYVVNREGKLGANHY